MQSSIMNKREELLGSKWKDLGNGYYGIDGIGGVVYVAYIALPLNHPDVGKHYDIIDEEGDLDVNGGLTFGEENIFGWDYGHYQNHSTPSKDIKNALRFFRGRENGKVKIKG